MVYISAKIRSAIREFGLVLWEACCSCSQPSSLIQYSLVFSSQVAFLPIVRRRHACSNSYLYMLHRSSLAHLHEWRSCGSCFWSAFSNKLSRSSKKCVQGVCRFYRLEPLQWGLHRSFNTSSIECTRVCLLNNWTIWVLLFLNSISIVCQVFSFEAPMVQQKERQGFGSKYARESWNDSSNCHTQKL